MKKIITLIPFLITYHLLSSQYLMNIDNKMYKDNIVLKDNINSENEVVIPEEPTEIIIQNNSYYNGNSESITSWTNVTNNCNVVSTNESVNINKSNGSNCQTNMTLKDPLIIQPDENFDISLTIEKINFSTNYATHILMPNFFSWYYNVGISSVHTTVRSIYRNSTWEVSIPNDYNNKATFRMHLEDNAFTFYKNGNVIFQDSNFNFNGLSNTEFRVFTNNASVNISDINIKIYK